MIANADKQLTEATLYLMIQQCHPCPTFQNIKTPHLEMPIQAQAKLMSQNIFFPENSRFQWDKFYCIKFDCKLIYVQKISNNTHFPINNLSLLNLWIIKETRGKKKPFTYKLTLYEFDQRKTWKSIFKEIYIQKNTICFLATRFVHPEWHSRTPKEFFWYLI